MPVYHSSFNEFQGTPICGTVMLPLKTKVKGPAPPARSDAADIIDEAIEYFRANVLFRNYKSNGAADLQIAYLTIYLGECLRILAKHKNKKDGQKNIIQLSMSGNFTIPGEKGFPLPGFFKDPPNRGEADGFRGYFRQLREEAAQRLVDTVYNADETQNKWWFSFQKRKFMNVDKC